jgi:2-oxoisovalerate dehydrogenase E1 component
MTKAILIDPVEMRKPAILAVPEIPLNSYVPDPAAELRKYGRGGLARIYRDMVIIREFETMLDRIKKEGTYQGIEYQHKGPAHLSIGQEASAVGQAYHLTQEDYIFGSHRSHGEILAKSLSALDKMNEADLLRIMETYLGGDPLHVVEKLSSGGSRTWRSTMCSTARWPRSLGACTASTAAWAVRCTPSSRLLA